MKISDIEEARMSPSTFAAAVEQGTGQGVLVGFEFEVCVPQATIDQYRQSLSKNLTAESVAQLIGDNQVFDDINIEGMPPEKFDSIFQLKPDASAKYPTAVEAYSAMRQSAVEQCREIFDQIPEKVREKFVPEIRRMRREFTGLDEVGKQLRFCYLLGYNLYIVEKGKIASLGWELRTKAAVNDWDKLFQTWLGMSDATASRRVGSLFDFDPDQAYSALELNHYFSDSDDYDDYDDYDYLGAAAVLEPAVAQTFGTNVHVFRRYHQKRKNSTDWYIEPDGSLTPTTEDDGAAEIVSPPLSAGAAITALRNFYTMAQQLGLYTNSTTGIHINVSIPQQIDLLKLAVFLGDQYVLSQFGRQDSDYAVSAQQSIAKQVAGSDRPLVKKQGIDYAKLQKIAKAATGTHTASISNNGKYISFRQAGGDYLADYAKIFETVGRFVRAMLIASDPSAYAQEYQTKLAKLVGQRSGQDTDMVMNIRTKGLPVYTVSLWRTGRSRFDSMIMALSFNWPSANLDSFDVHDIDQNSALAQQLIVSNLRSTDLKTKAQAQPVSQFATVTMVPLDDTAMDAIKNSQDRGVQLVHDGWKKLGYGLVRKSTLPATDPVAQTVLKQILQQRVGKK